MRRAPTQSIALESGATCPLRNDSPPTLLRRLRQLGVAGFAFFLVKGLLWLAVPWALMRLG